MKNAVLENNAVRLREGLVSGDWIFSSPTSTNYLCRKEREWWIEKKEKEMESLEWKHEKDFLKMAELVSLFVVVMFSNVCVCTHICHVHSLYKRVI